MFSVNDEAGGEETGQTPQTDAWSTAVLSLGSNLGDRLLLLRESLHHLGLDPGIEICAVSSVYETDAVGLTDQPPFYNIVVEIQTKLEPLALLRVCQQVENKFHRERKIKWGPRTIDIDIVIYDNVEMNTEELVIPHPRMEEREFVQLPWMEIKTGQIQVSRNVRPVYSQWY